MKVYFMRHGETELNVMQKLCGRIDCPLNETGVRQAKDAAAGIKEAGIVFGRVYSSPLGRAVETAKMAAGLPEEEIIKDERLLEFDLGPIDGQPISMMAVYGKDMMEDNPPEGMEKISDLKKRTAEFLVDLAEHETADTVLVVTHGVAMRGMFRYILDRDDNSIWGMMIHNCDLYESDVENGVFGEPRVVVSAGALN